MKLNLHADDPPTPEDDESALLALAGLNACHIAFQTGRAAKLCPSGLESILQGAGFESILREIDGSSRVSAGLVFQKMGPWIEMRFCRGSTLLKALTISFVTETGRFLVVAK